MMSSKIATLRMLLRLALAILVIVCATAGAREIAENTILHIGHSASLLKADGKILIFDYPYGSKSYKDKLYPLEPKDLKDEQVYIFASHAHGDHFNRGILTWAETIPRIKYILSSDIKRYPADAISIGPGRKIEIDGMKIRTYPSSDAGVAFSVYLAGRHIYFSGDNGFWNWKGDMSEEDYIVEYLSPIDRTLPIDIAFQVCAEKAQGKGEGGITALAAFLEPSLLIPIHGNGQYAFNKKAEQLVRTRGFENRFWPITKKGESFSIENLPKAVSGQKPPKSLHEAAAAARTDIARTLIAAGADINAKNADQRTPLHLAAALGGKDIAKLLIDHGADIEAKDKHARTPLHLATLAYRQDVVALLISAGANVNAVSAKQRTPLHIAASRGAIHIAEKLLKAGAQINAKDIYKQTPLHMAVTTPDIEFTRVLIARGAQIEAPDRMGTAPLHLAARANSKPIVELLLSKGAAVNVKDRSRRTPLHWAVMDSLDDMVEFLIEKGGDINHKDKYNQSPLKVTILSKDSTLEALLRKHGAEE